MDLMFLPGYRKLPDYRVFDAYTIVFYIIIVEDIKTDRRRNQDSMSIFFCIKNSIEIHP